MNYVERQSVPKVPEIKQGPKMSDLFTRLQHTRSGDGSELLRMCRPTTLHVCLTMWQGSTFLRGYTIGITLRKLESSDELFDKVTQCLVRDMFYSFKTNI